MSNDKTLVGQTIGQYKITGKIGAGGMATVYRAYQQSLEREIALKILPAHMTTGSDFLQRFLQEARAAAKMTHPHIVPIYEAGQANGMYFMAMAFIDGVSLAELLRREGTLTPERTAHLIGQMAVALDYAHRQGIVHRDIKPGNILVAEDDYAFLADFGIAKVAESVGLTRTGMLVGTPVYMAPEQARGGEVGPQTDQYALAVVAYRALTGHLLFSADAPHDVLFKQVNEEPDLSPLPASFRPIFERALAKAPEQRFTTAAEFSAALHQAAQGRPVELAPPPPTVVEPTVTDSASSPATDSGSALPRLAGGLPLLWLGAGGALFVGLLLLAAVGLLGFFAGRGSGVETGAGPSPAANVAAAEAATATATPTPTATSAPSATPTITLTPSPTPLPLEDLLIQDNNITAADWVIGPVETDDFASYSQGGRYHFAWANTSSDVWDFPDDSYYQDFAAEVEGELVSGDENHFYGLIFRMIDENNYYTVEISEDSFNLGKRQAGQLEYLLEWDASPLLVDGGPNTLQVIVKDDLISVFANGEPLAEVEDDAFPYGRVGVYASGGFGNEVALSNFKLWSLPDRPAAITAPTPTPRPTPTFAAVQAATVTMSKEDNASYRFGERVEFCFFLAKPGPARATVFQQDGRALPLGSWNSLGPVGDCIAGPMAANRGGNTVTLEALDGSGARDSLNFGVY